MSINQRNIVVMICALATSSMGCVMAQSFRDIATFNPATMCYLDTAIVSDISIGFEYDHMQKAIMQQLGTGSQLLSVDARSYAHISTSTTVWGAAGFKTGTIKDVKWNNCIDYMKVAPYVLGDGTGGDLSVKRYTFSGGYNGLFGRWGVGVEASYRAEIAYRNHDPRVKTVVSDLGIKAGGSYQTGANLAIGLNAGLEIYNQNCDLEFYNPLNDINTYPLTGLGTYYKRFTGNSTKDTGHQGLGYMVGGQLISKDGKGLSAKISYGHMRMNERLRDYNNLTLAYTDNDNYDLEACYNLDIGCTFGLTPTVTAGYMSRKGTENLFGTSAGSSYDVIGKRNNYKNDILTASLKIPVKLHVGNSNTITATPAMTLSNNVEKIIDLDRKTDVTHMIPSLSVDYAGNMSGRLIVDAGIDAAYAKASAPSSKNNILAQASSVEIEQLRDCMTSNYEMLTADHMSLGVRLGIGKQIDRIIYSLNLSYGFDRYISQGNCQCAAVTLRATF